MTTDFVNGTLGVTYTITGLAWPETLGDFTLMGPVNRLGSWRWYQQRIKINGAHVTKRIKLDSQLAPIWGSLRTIPHA